MTIRIFVLLLEIICLFTSQAVGLTLHFQYIADDGTGQIIGDDFYAIGLLDASVSDTLDPSDLRKPPLMPDAIGQIQTHAGTIGLIGDSRYLDTALPNHSWPIQLSLVASEPPAVIFHTLKLINPEELTDLPQGALVYLRRYDPNGIFKAYYNLNDSANHIMTWQTAEPDNPACLVDLMVIHGCIAANLDSLGAIDMKDFAILADYWIQNDVYGTADIDGSNSADLPDVVMMAQHWLVECLP